MEIGKWVSLFVLFFGVTSQAAEVRTRVPSYVPRNHINLNLAPAAAGGVGVSYEYVVTRRFTLGVFGDMFHLKGEDDYNDKTDVQRYGVTSRAFVWGHPLSSGFYGRLSLAQVMTKTSVVLNGGPTGTAPGSASSSEIGAVYGLGYQFAGPKITDHSRLLFNLGVSYGAGYAVEIQAQRTLSQTSVATTPRDSVFYEAGLSYLF